MTLKNLFNFSLKNKFDIYNTPLAFGFLGENIHLLIFGTKNSNLLTSDSALASHLNSCSPQSLTWNKQADNKEKNLV